MDLGGYNAVSHVFTRQNLVSVARFKVSTFSYLHNLEVCFFHFAHFFLFKEKNVRTLRLATAPYIANIFKIWVLGIISMLRRVRSTRVDIPYVHTDGTEISYIRHKNHQICVPSVCHMCAWCVCHMGAHTWGCAPS